MKRTRVILMAALLLFGLASGPLQARERPDLMISAMYGVPIALTSSSLARPELGLGMALFLTSIDVVGNLNTGRMTQARERYLVRLKQELLEEIAQGGGPHLEDLSLALGCGGGSAELSERLRQDFDRLAREEEAGGFSEGILSSLPEDSGGHCLGGLGALRARVGGSGGPR